MNSEDKSRWACVAQPRLPSSGFDHVAVGRVLDDACLSPCVLAATPSTLHLFRVNLPITAEGENQGLLVPLCSVSIFAQISGIACVPGGRQNSNQPTLKADNFIVLLRNGFIGLYRYEGTSNR